MQNEGKQKKPTLEELYREILREEGRRNYEDDDEDDDDEFDWNFVVPKKASGYTTCLK